MAVIWQCWQGTCEGQESSSMPALVLTSSFPGSCTAQHAADRPLQSLPLPHALPSVPKMPFWTTLGTQSQSRGVCKGQGMVFSQGCSSGRHLSLPAGWCLNMSFQSFTPSRHPPNLQLPAKSKFRFWILKIVIFNPIFRLSGAWGQPWADSCQHPPQGSVGVGRAHPRPSFCRTVVWDRNNTTAHGLLEVAQALER